MDPHACVVDEACPGVATFVAGREPPHAEATNATIAVPRSLRAIIVVG